MVTREVSKGRKRLLIVTTIFPPSRLVGGQRPARLARSIRAFGWEPYVLTLASRCQLMPDDRLGKDALPTTHVETVPCWSLWRHSTTWYQARSRTGRAFACAARAAAKLTAPFLPVDHLYPWAIAATRAGASLVRKHRIDLMWATSPWWSSLCLAHRIWKKTGIAYVLDFRDVKLAVDVEGMSFRDRLSLRIERAALRKAAGITYVAPAQAEALRRRYPSVVNTPQALTYNWFEAAEAAACPPRTFDHATILHGGGLYRGTRRLDGFLKALAILRRPGPAGAGDLRFLQLGGKSDPTHLSRAAVEHGLQEVVQIGSQLPRDEFLSACRGAKILLLAVGHDTAVVQHAGTIPAKLYDYLAACRPILVVGPRNCEAARMVTRLNRGLAAADDAPDEIADAIERLLEGRGACRSLDLSLEGVREYEASHAVARMTEFFDTVHARACTQMPGIHGYRPEKMPLA